MGSYQAWRILDSKPFPEGFGKSRYSLKEEDSRSTEIVVQVVKLRNFIDNQENALFGMMEESVSLIFNAHWHSGGQDIPGGLYW